VNDVFPETPHMIPAGRMSDLFAHAVLLGTVSFS
jgi:hypothetical protein